MRPLRFVSLFTTLLMTSLLSTSLLAQSSPVLPSRQPMAAKSEMPSGLSQPDAASQAKIVEKYGKLPLSFEVNQGQTDAHVKFLSHMCGYSLFLTGDEAVLALRGKTNIDKTKLDKAISKEMKLANTAQTSRSKTAATGAGDVLRMKLRNANGVAKVTGVDELVGTSNYFIGNDPAKWQTNVPTYAKVKYEGVYSGIDLVYYGNQRQLEYDFVVAPGADPSRIAFDVSGAKRIRRDAQGDLVFKMKTGGDEIRWQKPVVYQEKDGARELVAAHYAITDTNSVGFEVARYDATRPLYIDPLLTYSTYLGGSGYDQGNSIAIDSAGNAYVVGLTQSTDFPTKSPLQSADDGLSTVFVTKINAAGSALVYSTYLGGTGGDEGNGIAVDSAGNAYVTGSTSSVDFPTKNPLQPNNDGGADAFVTKINAAGSALVYSTYLGGSSNDSGLGIAVGSSGDAYVIGNTCSTNFPTMNPIQLNYAGGDYNQCGDAFVAAINSAGSALVYSTYLGGSGYDQGNGIAVDSSGNAYVTGYTDSTNFPLMNPLQPTNAGEGDAFVAKINPTGSALIYSTYQGSTGPDTGAGIAADSAGNAYVAYTTGIPNCLHFACASAAFALKINPTGSAFVYESGPLGQGHWGASSGIAVDSSGSAYLIGTNTKNFNQTFMDKLNPAGELVGASYLHTSTVIGLGIAADNAGDAYVTGYTDSTKFTTKGPVQSAYAGGGADAFILKINMGIATTTTLSSSPNPSTQGQAVTFTAAVTSTVGAPPNGETVTFKKGSTVLGTGTLSDGSASFITSTLKSGTNSITAVYGGDSNLIGSTSKAVKQVVDKAEE